MSTTKTKNTNILRPRIADEEAPVVRSRDDPDLPNRRRLITDLVRIREAQGLTQADVALRMGISQPSVAQFEKQTNWYMATLTAYARAIECDLNFRLRMDSTPFEADVNQSGRPA